MCSFFSQGFASDKIDVSLSADSIKIWESVDLSISSYLEDSSGNIEIPWIQNFQIFSQSSGHSFQSLNGETKSVSNYTLSLRPLKEGAFLLGPVKIYSGTWSIEDDEVLEIRVSNILGSVNTETEWEEEQEAPNTMAQQREEDLYGLRSIPFPYLGIALLCIAFLIGFYLLLQRILEKENTSKSITLEVERVKHGESFIQLFEKIREQNKKLSSQDFFRVFHNEIRRYFESIWYKNATRQTLSEMRKSRWIQDSWVFKVFEKTYKNEFLESVELSIKERDTYVTEIIHILKKQW